MRKKIWQELIKHAILHMSLTLNMKLNLITENGFVHFYVHECEMPKSHFLHTFDGISMRWSAMEIFHVWGLMVKNFLSEFVLKFAVI